MERVIEILETLCNDKFQFIRDTMAENSITYAELGRSLGTSRQSIFDTLHSDNMQLKTVINICQKVQEIIGTRQTEV